MFKYERLPESVQRRLENIGPNVDLYWDKIIDFLVEDSHGQIVSQVLGSFIRRGDRAGAVSPAGYPTVKLVGFRGPDGGLGKVKAEFGIDGYDKLIADQYLDPAKPADLGIEAIRYFGRFLALVKQDKEVAAANG